MDMNALNMDMDTLNYEPTPEEMDEVVLDSDAEAWMKDILSGLTGDDAGYEGESIEDDEDF